MAIQAQMYAENLGLPFFGSQDFMENGCGINEFSFNLQHQKQQQQRQRQFLLQFQNQQQPKNQFLAFENNLLFPHSKNCTNTSSTATTSTTTTNNHDNLLSSSIFQSMAAQFEKQRQEIDGYISLQNERLKLALQEQSKQQLASLLRKMEATATMLLRHKDEEIARATNRTSELEDYMRKMEVENQVWQRVAAEKEAMIASLNTTLDQLREKAGCLSTADDAESCCVEKAGENRGDDDDDDVGETTAFGGERKMMCRICHSRNSCVLFLPCRHLCSCKACEAFLDTCPVCNSVKQASIEALIS
ncbi:hypothetical protein Nepgr_004794 [Nepenthes gracilis]|uniref:RING-type domain-containing protein n=1 Tax=Nepenthes gracilis TaxID=150966 RepID=A0AAD3XFN9_NEPGR|nr:hypothetical protein Nepgr_004794 [Nepenthes gracilis]